VSNIIEMINRRRLIDGPDDKLMCISPLKHKWAMDVFKLMRKNEWSPESIAMGNDRMDYLGKLDDAERSMYDKALAFVSNLDGIQFNNLITNIGVHITSPEVSMAVARQAYEEANHVLAYSLMAEAVSENPLSIYGMYESDAILAAKNKFIMTQSDELAGEFTPEKFALAVIGNICLEGIYFFSGFLAFYVLAKHGKMLKSADNVKYIQRDELTHLKLFVGMYQTLQRENPEVFTPEFFVKARRIVTDAVDLEVSWGKHIISAGVLGVTDPIVEGYIRHLANVRVAEIGWEPIYPGQKNPIPWVDAFSKVGDTNFFEGKPIEYQAGGLEW
jgi:ribonucleoside-diphosphate reductase beta chain